MSNMRRLIGLMKKVALPAYATWNPSDKTSGVTLSNGDLTATYGGTLAQARTTITKTTGKWYWEYTLGAGFTGGVGTTNLSAVLATDSSNDPNAWQWYYANGVIYQQGGSLGSYYPLPAAGDVIGFALDCDARACTVLMNNVQIFTLVNASMPPPKTVFTGSMSPYFTLTGGSLTANFGATAFTYTPMAGYNAGIYT